MDKLLITGWNSRLSNTMHMARSATEAYQEVFPTAVDLAYGIGRKNQGKRAEALINDDYQGVRIALDEAPDDFIVSRMLAQFYLHMSPGLFAKALKKGPHPFKEPAGGAPMVLLRSWYARLSKEAESIDYATWWRDENGRPFLVTPDGKIMGEASTLSVNLIDIADALNEGADLQVIDLTLALKSSSQWVSQRDWQAWSNAHMEGLRQQAQEAAQALADYQAYHLEQTTAKVEEKPVAVEPCLMCGRVHQGRCRL